jgi:hypothetical protein
VLREWKQERSGVKDASKPRPSSTRKPHSKEWIELALFFGPEELAKFDRLRDLLSHRLGTRDPHAVLSWLMELGLDKVDPVRQQARAEIRAQARAGNSTEARAGEAPETRTEKDAEARAGNATEARAGKAAEARADRAPETRTKAARTSKSAEPRAGATADADQLGSEKKPEAFAPNRETAHRDFHDAKHMGRPPVRIPIPALRKRRTWVGGQGKCQFRDEKTGRICGATAFLQLDHILEVRNGGTNAQKNLRLLCRLHNARRHLWDSG